MATALERLKLAFAEVMQTVAQLDAKTTQVNNAHNGLVDDHNTLVRLQNLNFQMMSARIDALEVWALLPWYKRLFTNYPLKPKPTKEEKSIVRDSGEDSARPDYSKISEPVGVTGRGSDGAFQEKPDIDLGGGGTDVGPGTGDRPDIPRSEELPKAVRERIVYPDKFRQMTEKDRADRGF
jgi:hypothetical protein